MPTNNSERSCPHSHENSQTSSHNPCPKITSLAKNPSTRPRNRNRNRKLQTSKAPLKSQAQGTSLFTSAASNQRCVPKNSPREAQVRLPEGERREIRR